MRMRLATLRTLALALIIPVGLAACAPDDGAEMDDDGLEETGTATMQPTTVMLRGDQGSALSGEAVFTPLGEEVQVALTIMNVPMDEEDVDLGAHIRAGTCMDRQTDVADEAADATDVDADADVGATNLGEADQGETVVDLENLERDDDNMGDGEAGQAGGTLSSESTFDLEELEGVSQAYVEITRDGESVACGDIRDMAGISHGGSTAPMDADGHDDEAEGHEDGEEY